MKPFAGYLRITCREREVCLMFDDVYQKEQDDVKAPEYLKTKTLQKMGDSRKDQRNVFKLKPMWGLAFSCVVVIVVVLNWTNILDSNPELVTDLVFARLDGGPRRFAVIGDNGSLAEAELIMGASISGLYLEGFDLEDVAWGIDEDNVRIQHAFERNDSSIRILLNNRTDYVSTNSILNDLPLALYYRVMLLETTFIAEFLYDDIYYQIEAVGLSEEEFIGYLKKIIIFLN